MRRSLHSPAPVLAAALLAALPAFAAPELPAAATVAKLRSARIARMQGDPDLELRLLQEAWRDDPGSLVAATALLDRYRRIAPDPAALAALRAQLAALVVAEPPPSLAVLRQVTRLVGKELDEGLREALVRALARHPVAELSEPVALALLANTLIALERADLAVAPLEKLQRLQPAEGVNWSLYSAYLRLERYGDALALLEPHLEKMPMLWPFVDHLLVKTGQFARLAAEVERRYPLPVPGAAAAPAPPAEVPLVLGESSVYARGHEPAPPDVGLAWLLYDHHQLAASERIFRVLAARYPASESVRLPLLHLFATPEERAALASAGEDRWSRERNAEALFDEGSRRVSAGDVQGGLALLERAAAGMPDSEAAWYNLGMTAFKAESWGTAGSALGKAAQLNPERPGTAFYAGVALSKIGQCAEAIPQLKRALVQEPGRANAHHYLAECHGRLGQAAEAERQRELFRKAKAGG